MPADDRKGFLPHGPEVFKGFTRYTTVFKKPNPNPLTDVTFRPNESVMGVESSVAFTESMLGMPSPDFVRPLESRPASS